MNPELIEQEQRVRQALTDLGRFSWQVAWNLRRHNATGYRHHVHACPVANYLKQQAELPPGNDLSVSTDVMWWPGGYGYGRITVPLPKGVRRFVAAFDGGLYRSLRRGSR